MNVQIIFINSDNKSLLISEPMAFSTKSIAEIYIENYDKMYSSYDEKNKRKVLCFILEYEYLHYKEKVVRSMVYSSLGTLIGTIARKEGNSVYPLCESYCKEYNSGDLIEAMLGDSLVYGIVIDKPVCLKEDTYDVYTNDSDNFYTIINYPDLEIEYVYPPLIFEFNKKNKGYADIKRYLEIAFELYKKKSLKRKPV